ncbi:MAG: hypothetical protein V3V86_11155 [Gammaproteobacteria bacterium]
MLARKATRFADKAAHIMGTYGLPLQPELLDSLQRELRDSNPDGRHRLAEEEAAIFLARALHAMVIAALRADIDAGGLLAAWSKFTQQVMYRADLGLINMVMFSDEILPLIDDVEQILRQEFPAGEFPQTRTAPRRSGAPL